MNIRFMYKNNQKIIKNIIVCFLIIIMVITMTGCRKEEKEFSFENVGEVKIYASNLEKPVQIIDTDKVQKVIKPISDIVWEKEDNEENLGEIESSEYVYRIQCYDVKGEKKQNIYICSPQRIIYKSKYWNAEKGELDLQVFKDLF